MTVLPNAGSSSASTRAVSGVLAWAALAILVTADLASADLLVAGFDSDAAHRYDATSGAVLGALAPIPGAQSMQMGPDGRLYVCAEKEDRVLRYDGVTGAFVDAFVEDDPLTPEDENGPLDGPTGAIFGPDGNLYVASFETDAILRYHGSSGAYLGAFVAPASGTLNGPDAGIVFGPDGALYVPSFFNSKVLRYDGQTGAFLETFVSSIEGGLTNPRTVRFRSDGVCFVSSEGSGKVLTYSAAGVFIGVYVNLGAPTGLEFSPVDGDLYVASIANDTVKRYDPFTKALKGTVVTSGAGGLLAAVALGFLPGEIPDFWLNLGGELAGAGGPAKLSGKGLLAVGASVGFELSGAAPSALGAYVIGASAIDLPLFGGVLVPSPDALVPLVCDASGAHAFSVVLGSAVPAGAAAWIQAWTVDTGGPEGFAASNALTAYAH